MDILLNKKHLHAATSGAATYSINPIFDHPFGRATLSGSNEDCNLIFYVKDGLWLVWKALILNDNVPFAIVLDLKKNWLMIAPEKTVTRFVEDALHCYRWILLVSRTTSLFLRLAAEVKMSFSETNYLSEKIFSHCHIIFITISGVKAHQMAMRIYLWDQLAFKSTHCERFM